MAPTQAVVAPCPMTAVSADASWQTAPPADDPSEEPGETGYWDGYWEGEEWIAVWVPYEGASSEAVEPSGETESPPPQDDPPGQAPCPGGGEQTATAPPPAVPNLQAQPAAAAPIGGAAAMSESRPGASNRRAEPRSRPESTPERELDAPRFVARALLAPFLGEGLNPLFLFVVGAAGLVLYTLLASTATGRRHALR